MQASSAPSSSTVAAGGSSASESSWVETLNNAIPAIVVIRILKVRAFDGKGAAYSKATGFVVDKKNGYILTNRHVVNSGPVVADAIFVNKEEVALIPIYRDPVHDFGILKFDPSSIKFLDPMVEIPLAPDEAKIGIEIRVVGNDSGEKLSILPGILAKLDRDAPNYGSSSYNDFNTFYYAAASSTSGGSSGSPVLNIQGKAIALNAGGNVRGASSYYLPLYRVARALKLLQSRSSSDSVTQQLPPESSIITNSVDKEANADANANANIDTKTSHVGKVHEHVIPRGTLQVIWKHKAFDEVKRLGLSSDTLSLVRKTFPKETGMLVVDQVLPSSCANQILHPGDVLVSFNGKPQTTFVPIEEYLDDHVHDAVTLQIERGDNQTHQFTFQVQDLHSITPSRFLEISDSVLHSLSYQQARNADLPVGSVYLTKSGYMLAKAGIPCPCIITSIDSQETPTLDKFIEIVSDIPSGTRTTLKYFVANDRHRTRTAVITMDRQWFEMQIYQRNDHDGLWHITPCREPTIPNAILKIPETPPTPLTFHSATGDANSNVVDDDIITKSRIIQSLVLVTFDIPYIIDGVSSSSYKGTGFIIDKTNGYVMVDRNTVPNTLGDVVITISASIEIPATVVFVHPVHNYSIVSYDPKLLGPKTIVEEISLSDDDAKMTIGQTFHFVGLTSRFTVVSQHNPCITKFDRVAYRSSTPPKYRATNVELVLFDKVTKSDGGIFIDKKTNEVVCLWLSFAYQDEKGNNKETFRGLPVKIIRDIVKKLKTGSLPSSVTVLPIELLTYSLSKARSGMGLSNDWATKLEQCQNDRRQVIGVKRCAAAIQTKSTGLAKAEEGGVEANIAQQTVTNGSAGAIINSPNTEEVAKNHKNSDVPTKTSSVAKKMKISDNVNKKLEAGDIILSIDNQVITKDWDVEYSCYNKTEISKIAVLRNHAETHLTNVPLTSLSSIGTDRIIVWAGMMLQAPHNSVISVGYVPEEGGGVYVSRWYRGSPANKYGLHATIWIIEVNGTPTPTMDAFVRVVQNLRQKSKNQDDRDDIEDSGIRLKTRDLNTKVEVFTLKPDYHYWPSIELRRNNITNKWERNLL